MHLYREFPPHPGLARHVACLWTSHAWPDGTPVRTRVLPDNYIDILWQDRAPMGFVAGMMSRAHRVDVDRPVLTLAVRFLPGAARACFDLPLQSMQDAHPALDDLWPRHEAEALAAALWERDRTPAQRLATLERALLARLRTRTHADAPARADALVRTAIRLIDASGGALRVEDLATRLGVSRQTLALQFRERVGMNAKTFAMVSQFRHAHAALRRLGEETHADAGRQRDAIDWARLAADCGYYDQSHLVHAFRQFAGETPAAFHFSNTGP